jgi:hypothetical protein
MPKEGRAISLGRERGTPTRAPAGQGCFSRLIATACGNEEIPEESLGYGVRCSADVFALATALSKPKYNRRALEFVSSSEMP